MIQQSHTEGLGPPGFRQAWSQDVPGSSTSGLQLLHLDRTSGGSSIPLEAQEILVVAEDAKCISGTESGKHFGTRTDDKTHQTARGGKIVRRNASIEELDKGRRTPANRKEVTSTTILEEENTALKEQVRELKEQIQ